MAFNDIVILIMAVSALIGAIDLVFGNKLHLGQQFEDGFKMMGTLALSMVGIITLAPVIGHMLNPMIAPIFKLFGVDPSLVASVLALDMGGYPLAQELAVTQAAADFSGIIVSSMLGVTLVFSIPVGLGIIEKEDQSYFAKGILIGTMTIPIGSFIGGFAAGYDTQKLMINIIPVALLSLVLILGFLFFQETLIKLTIRLAHLLKIIILIGLSAGLFEHLTGIVLIAGMAPVTEGLAVVGESALVLAGAFPFVSILTRVLKKPFQLIGDKLNMNVYSTAGILIGLAHSIPVFSMYKQMDARGKVMNVAWIVTMTASLGAHLGYIAGVNPNMITPSLIGRFSAGLLALVIAYFATKRTRLTKI